MSGAVGAAPVGTPANLDAIIVGAGDGDHRAHAQRSRARGGLVGLDIAGNKPAHNALLYDRDNGKHEIGSVMSATWSPTCKRNIALAMVDAPYFRTGQAVWAEIYLNRELVWERRMRPFFAPIRRRATPSAEF